MLPPEARRFARTIIIGEEARSDPEHFRHLSELHNPQGLSKILPGLT